MSEAIRKEAGFLIESIETMKDRLHELQESCPHSGVLAKDIAPEKKSWCGKYGPVVIKEPMVKCPDCQKYVSASDFEKNSDASRNT